MQIMKTSTLKWTNALGITLLIAILALVLLTLTMQSQILFVSVGWHGVASVGWVT
jgi:hypothetical protein